MAGFDDPADRVTLDESVSMALLVVLERLSPAERTAFVLHDVFGVPFPEIAEVVGRTPAAVRQLASRARRQVEDGRPRTPVTEAEQRELVTAFAAACQNGDLPGLIALLDPDVVLRGDGGGQGRHAAARRAGGGARGPACCWPVPRPRARSTSSPPRSTAFPGWWSGTATADCRSWLSRWTPG
ncbi:sigma factor-like helix-turn-helix DNA-binding protein [Actinomadura madurae]|uniref:sigma factor-like helix-turn-helix DNA-binding protein n=1 Tax=Actinomadura madurae TaxID=1993 RepID=UPI0020D21299|nr:sigma factor-like helix-turn-helix DNA-binding protein [Actinomadura madurae]MCQ0021270.1 hypothetical protein [Actinomadura madurae]